MLPLHCLLSGVKISKSRHCSTRSTLRCRERQQAMPRVVDDTDKGPRGLEAAQDPCHVHLHSGERGAARRYADVGILPHQIPTDQAWKRS